MRKMQKRRAGRKKFQETRHPVYKGVRERKGKWVCELRQPKNKTRVWLGTFSHPDMAAIAYDVAAFAFKGEAAILNFPHKATALPRLNSQTCSIRSIQFAAMQAAENHFSCGDDNFKLLPSEARNGGSSESESSLEYSLDWVDLNGGCKGKSSEDSGRSFFWDEEEVFNMQGLMDSMAEGLIITPPALQRGFNWVSGETTLDLTLWQN